MSVSTPNTVVEGVKELHVAVGVIQKDGRFLLTQRHAKVHEGGRWEFPGGKVEPGEFVEAALERELDEELGIRVERSLPLIEIPYRYPELRVRLYVRRVTGYSGTPAGREGQPLEWYTQSELTQLSLPAANRGILAAILLPERYLITPEPKGDTASFLDHLERVLSGGDIRLVQLRAKQLDDSALLRLTQHAIERCERYGARLMVNAHPEFALRAGAYGVHLSSAVLAALEEEKASIPSTLLSGASCHDLPELKRALSVGVDYVLCAPVLPTASHPGAPTLGWDRFAALCAESAVPVYALGGIGLGDIPRIRTCGGHGAAGIGAFWGTGSA